MKHPTDDMLLAYVRQQQRHLWPPGIQEHVALCSVCSAKCSELQTMGNMLTAHARSSTLNPAYATVSNRVMRKLYEPKPSLSQRVQRGVARIRVGLSIAVVLGVLCVVLFAGLEIRIAGNVARFNVPHPTPTLPAPIQTSPIPRQPTATPIPSPTGTSIVSGGTSPTATPATKKEPSIATNAPCTTEIDALQNHLHVCGSNFTPGSTVLITYVSPSNKKEAHFQQVHTDGTFTDTLEVASCRNIPVAIYAQYTTDTSKRAEIVKNILFGGCQIFGGFKK